MKCERQEVEKREKEKVNRGSKGSESRKGELFVKKRMKKGKVKRWCG